MQWRTPITLAVLVLILLGATYYGWHQVVSPATGSSDSTGAHGSQARSKEVCLRTTTYPRGASIRAAAIKVNVYNASDVSGRATAVLAGLHAAGFKPGGVAANAPGSVTATNVSIVTLTPRSPAVQLLRQQFKGVVRVVRGPEIDPGLDVVVGAHFAGLAPQAPAVLTLRHPRTVCLTWVRRSTGKS